MTLYVAVMPPQEYAELLTGSRSDNNADNSDGLGIHFTGCHLHVELQIPLQTPCFAVIYQLAAPTIVQQFIEEGNHSR